MSIDFTKCRLSNSGNIITPKGRLSFCQSLLVAKENKNGRLIFGTSLLIPPTSNIDLLKTAAETCAKEKWGGKMPSKIKTPFLKAEDYEYEGYEPGWVLIRPSAITKPGIVDASGKNVDEERDIYPGRWAVISVRAFAYDVDGNRGVSFGLQNVQLLEHDSNIAGRARAEDEFEAVDVAVMADGKKESADSVFG